MNQQLSILQAITSNFVHRVGRDQLIRDLPIKREHVVLLRLTEAQETMYQAYLQVPPNAVCTSFTIPASVSMRANVLKA